MGYNEYIVEKKLDEAYRGNYSRLELKNNCLSAIPEKINDLTNLKYLDLRDNNISEIKGLENLTNLQILNLYGNKISKIQGLENLTNLQLLYLGFNEISELKGLENLTNLQILNLGNNKISKIQGLENLTNLQRLNLGCNQISMIEGLENLTNLEELYFGGNPLVMPEGLNPHNVVDVRNHCQKVKEWTPNIIIQKIEKSLSLDWIDLNHSDLGKYVNFIFVKTQNINNEVFNDFNETIKQKYTILRNNNFPIML